MKSSSRRHPAVRRKRPQQARAKWTVDCLLKATAECLERQGMSRLTTTRVAERAGVSIGTLYQYFPTRSALVAALIESQSKREGAYLASVLDESDSLPQMVEKVVRAYFSAVAKNQKLFIPLIDALYSICRRQDIHRLERAGIARLEELLRRYGCTKRDLTRTAFLFYYSFIGLLRFAALVEPRYLNDDEFLEETIEVVKGIVGAEKPKRKLRKIRHKLSLSSIDQAI